MQIFNRKYEFDISIFERLMQPRKEYITHAPIYGCYFANYTNDYSLAYSFSRAEAISCGM